jgi:CspA family cold shock protein
MESTATQKEGQVKFYDRAKGFGFIKESDGNELFVHATGLVDDSITKDDHVSYEVIEGKKGLNAVKVKKI